MHNNILTKEQQELIPLIQSFSQDYYLVGGTALALQYGHRRSVDFDLFCHHDFDNTRVRAKIKRHFPIDTIFLESQGELTVMVNKVKITFFHFPYDVPALETWDKKLQLPNPLTIGSMKAFALGMRSKWKDYADLYIILQHHSLQEIIDLAEKIFGVGEFNSKLFREQLAYHEDINYFEEIEWMPGFETPRETILESLVESSLS